MAEGRTPHENVKAKANPLGAIGRKPGSYVGNLDSLLSEVSDAPMSRQKEHAAVPEKASRAGSTNRKSTTKRINLDVPIELHQRFKGATGMAGRTMTDVLQELIRDYLDGQSL